MAHSADVALALSIAMSCIGCGGRRPADGAARQADPAAHSRSEEARWAALAMPHRRVREALGGHRFEARHEVSSRIGEEPGRALVEEYLLECGPKGDCHGRLNNSREYGVEFVRVGEATFFRHRYQDFLRFSEEREESERRVEHLFGIGAATLELLYSGVRLLPAGEAAIGGRKAARYRLTSSKMPRPVAGTRGAKAWRARLKVERADGELWLEKDTGAPVRVEVRYRVSAPKGGRMVVLTGSLRTEIKAIGKPVEVKPPPRFTEASPRDRESLDLRALLGDHRLNPGWFRGGGPHAARDRERGQRPTPPGSQVGPAGMGPGVTRTMGPGPRAAGEDPASSPRPAARPRPAPSGAP